MPWEIKKQNDKFCVYKKGESESITCHDTEDKAKKHMAALYANENKMHERSYLQALKFDDWTMPTQTPVDEQDKTGWIQAIPFGQWNHPIYGTVVFDRTKAEVMKVNFDNDVRGQEIATDYDHGLDPAKGGKASGWIRDMEVRTDGMYWNIEWTDTARQEISAGEWKYFSPEWLDWWSNPSTGDEFTNVAIGGGLTNKPFFKGMVPVNFFTEQFADTHKKFTTLLESVETQEDYETAKALLETLGESKEWEHSEPGTGNPPEPRTDEDGSDDKAIESGSRRDPLPVESLDSVEGGKTSMNPELLKKLGLAEDATQEQIDTAVQALYVEVEPVREAARQFNERKTFAEQFPEQAKRMAELETTDRDNKAKAFSESVTRLNRLEGDKVVASNYGLSALAIEKIKEVHKKFNEGSGTTADFEAAIAAIRDGGILEYGERGTSHDGALDTAVSTATSATSNPRMLFHEKVVAEQAAILAKDGNKLTERQAFSEAIAAAARKHPDLYAEYRKPLAA